MTRQPLLCLAVQLRNWPTPANVQGLSHSANSIGHRSTRNTNTTSCSTCSQTLKPHQDKHQATDAAKGCTHSGQPLRLLEMNWCLLHLEQQQKCCIIRKKQQSLHAAGALQALSGDHEATQTTTAPCSSRAPQPVNHCCCIIKKVSQQGHCLPQMQAATAANGHAARRGWHTQLGSSTSTEPSAALAPRPGKKRCTAAGPQDNCY